MILVKSMSSISPQQMSSAVYLEVQAPAILGNKYL